MANLTIEDVFYRGVPAEVTKPSAMEDMLRRLLVRAAAAQRRRT